ncbi:hypothetical protein CLAFUW4_06522 [Fulvia fulva]|uniref:Uncharacterized protein n=1 Tax=Passalora fulva TaxID=5499 RepID=A0A9Q8LIT5_PASFU|nr:uncharacterized protein CLAFUR5_06670 [Fulvia fulva]KAK4621546.1 hypothetical protein CLAFUR4_06530 [Fulvia fulva]KAK4622634.1 hypothetical protein CLAFUR0_06526 [Fulvia fulva]UJO18426.1 hypothetical protein CLAFUR5_06670 [Fulvia fulva]WPV16810.1 hypothetical protein CLAFUW4_06522 [Fulvia fulva]WPV31359.1 hypothetical protein CLAFUW7_06521 [Fulvia fulva]
MKFFTVAVFLLSSMAWCFSCEFTNMGDGICVPNAEEFSRGWKSQLCFQESVCKEKGDGCIINARRDNTGLTDFRANCSG